MSLRIERDLSGGGVEDVFSPKEPPSEEDQDRELALRLAENIAAFLRAGGSFTWTEWRSLSGLEREVATRAGEFVEDERLRALAAYTATALSGPAGTASVLDDEEVREDVAEAETLARSRRLRGRFRGGF